MGLQSKNRKEWSLLHLALMMVGGTTNALYDTLGPDAIQYVIETCRLKTIAVTSDIIKGFIKDKTINVPDLKNFVVLDELTKEQDTEIRRLVDEKFNSNVAIHTFNDVLEAGKKAISSFVPAKVGEDHNAIICWTSGTTGTPKGVKLTHGNLLYAAYGVSMRQDYLRFTPQDCYCSYLPSAHSFEQILFSMALTSGCKVGYYGGDPKKLVGENGDIPILKPTLFATVPRLLNVIYGKITGGLNAATGLKKCLASKAVATK